MTLLLIFRVEGLLRLKGQWWSNLHMSLNWTVSFIPAVSHHSSSKQPHFAFIEVSLESNCLARANVQTTIPIFNLLGQQKVTLQHSWKKLHYNLLPYEKISNPNRKLQGSGLFSRSWKSFAASVTDKLEIKFMKRKKIKLRAKYLLLFCLTNAVGGGNIVHIFRLSHHKCLCAQLRVPGKLAVAGQKHSETSYSIQLVHCS